ncbi:hypothetical protein HDU67_000731, partial [Dinochytrium kinnereticum]
MAVVNDNYNITAYLDGERVANLYCPLPFDTAPVWTLGIRDWSTDVARKNQLSPIFPLEGEIAEFRMWRRPLPQAEILSRMHRTLNNAEILDRSLMLYFDLNNITDGYIIHDMSPTKRLTGFMGGALGLEINIPQLVPTSAPIVNTSTSVVNVVMKESGDYASTVPIPLFAVNDLSPSFSLLTSTSGINYFISSLPDPNVLSLSIGQPNSTSILSGAAPIALGSSFDIFVTHKANPAVASWPLQTFSVTVRFGSDTVVVPVNVRILKNAAPILGDSGGAIAPSDQPAGSIFSPIFVPTFTWRNATYKSPVTFEFWTVGAEDDRAINLPDVNYQSKGRFNAEINKNLVMDYGWDYDGSGRTAVPYRKKFGIWNHVAMVSTGLGGTHTMYLNGDVVAQVPGNIAMRENNRGLPPSNATGFIDAAMAGNIVVDELRVWNIARTTEEIRSTMAAKLTGKERGLYMYHDFDSFDVQKDGSYLFRDIGPYGFDLICRGYNSPTGCPFTRSSIPIGGSWSNISFADASNVTYWNPLGQDVDDDTNVLRFVVDTLPTDARMLAERNQTLRSFDGDLRNGVSNPNYVSPISVGSYIRKMQFIPSVMIVPS